MKSKEKWEKAEECRVRKNKQALKERGGRDEYKREGKRAKETEE